MGLTAALEQGRRSPTPSRFPSRAVGWRHTYVPGGIQRPFLLPDVIDHLEQFTGTADDQLVFTGPKGAQLRRSNFTRQWRKALEAAGMTSVHFHDLRHKRLVSSHAEPGTVLAVPQVRVSARWISCLRTASIEI